MYSCKAALSFKKRVGFGCICPQEKAAKMDFFD